MDEATICELYKKDGEEYKLGKYLLMARDDNTNQGIWDLRLAP